MSFFGFVLFYLHLVAHLRHMSTSTSFQALRSKAVFFRCFQVLLAFLVSDIISRLQVFLGLPFFSFTLRIPYQGMPDYALMMSSQCVA
jgi:hypothetical protein